jgi:hypothetical protein
MSSAYTFCAFDYGVAYAVVEVFSVSIDMAVCGRRGEFLEDGSSDGAFACCFETMQDYISSWRASNL